MSAAGSPDTVEQYQEMFGEYAGATASRAPLYARLAAGIAGDAELSALLDGAPPAQRQPGLLFACVHALLLAEPDDELAGWYPNLTERPADSDPLPAFRDFCRRRRAALDRLLATRATQTNEIGRCALLLPAMAMVADEVGPLGHLDVGASAGLNLLLPHYAYRYEPGGQVGRPSDVVLTCGTRGGVPVPAAVPVVARAVGLDRAPIRIEEEDRTRWLQACVWPDQTDRFERLRAAVDLARRIGVDVRAGDAIDDTPALVEEVAASGHPVVTTTWVLSYLTTEQRRAYVAALDDIGRDRDVSWIYAESPSRVPGVPFPGRPSPEPVEVTALVLVRWRRGVRDVRHLARCHPHGYWMHWRRQRRGLASALG